MGSRVKQSKSNQGYSLYILNRMKINSLIYHCEIKYEYNMTIFSCIRYQNATKNNLKLHVLTKIYKVSTIIYGAP